MKARNILIETPSSNTSARSHCGAGPTTTRHLRRHQEKELVGNFKNGGTDYRPKGDPQRVNVHDFEDKKLGKVVPYGVYDVTANTGFVSVGITSDTAEFAVQSIRCWLERMGRQRYPNPRELTVTADCGGSNGARVRLWKLELQKLADETGLVIRVHHYPPAHRNGTRSSTGCSVTSRRTARPAAYGSPCRGRVDRGDDHQDRSEGRKRARHAQLPEGHQGQQRRNECLDITGDQFHPEWNYTIRPRTQRVRSSYCSKCP